MGSSRPEHHINLNYLPQLVPPGQRSGSSTAATSPIEPPSGNTVRYPLGSGNGVGNIGSAAVGSRLGTGSPSHEFGGSRLFSKRAREIQAQEGLAPQVWGPPTSGNSTPLRETIPESPNGDSFPDFNIPVTEPPVSQASTRRARAGTLPSRFSPASASNPPSSQPSLLPKTSRPTPSTSPFKPGSHTPTEPPLYPTNSTSMAAKAALLSRLRAGSMPQRASYVSSSSSPFGSSVFSSSWTSGRDRGSTLASIQSSNGPSSPAQSSFSRDSLADTDVKTLDYLGLVDTPQQPRATLAPSDIELILESQRQVALQTGNIADLAALARNANRFRSYSVNAKEKYAAEDEDELAYLGGYPSNYSGSLTPTTEGNPAAYAIHEAVRQHNMEVQAFANFASANRPRARTAGVLDSPSTRLLRNYLPTPSRLDTSITASEMPLTEEAEYSGLTEAVQGLQLNGKPTEAPGEDNTLEGPTRALWLGNIPSSTTVSSLNVIFNNFGPIESARVLTHKNCGFVNFEALDSAVRAKSQLNGKEIFPGAGPVRIGYAKVPSAAATPGNNGIHPSPSPDPTAKGAAETAASDANNGAAPFRPPPGLRAEAAPPSLTTPKLQDVRNDVVQIVKELGASDEEQMRIAASVEQAIKHDQYEMEIPNIQEPNHNRMHDAPRLREIRKRIDNNTCTVAEIEDVAMGMLPEIAELSSDYLGNTVVQKMFEYCSENVKEAMLSEIAPHLAEIGVHKNGTWAAQKIIDVARTPTTMRMIVTALQPYSVALFLDQFGNYVMQGCLRYQYPLNNFIFEVMLNRLWELAQGRFGARAMRACLESHYATKDQQRMVAAVIALHSVQLATNANGALLLTWFLDTCTFPHRRTVLAPRLVPHLVHLCTHKVAYLTVLKIINQRNEPEARDAILQALFFSPNDRVLEEILSDQSCGATLIFKKIRPDVVQNVRNVLLRIKAQPAQGYKRLMDEVGLSTRGGLSGRDIDGSRPAEQTPFYPGMPQAAFDPAVGLQRTTSVDSNGFEPFHQLNGLNTQVFTPNLNVNGPLTPVTAQQLQYQQAMLQAASAGRPPASFYPSPIGAGYPSPAGPPPPGMEAYRNVASGPLAAQVGGMQVPQNGFAQAGDMRWGMYQYPMQYMQPLPQGQGQGVQQGAGGRRGRR
ncbi:hypothetical protein H2199_006392 [Coniosporium tulheliwenetii]|uniref:Uncharacterized protein n=1 Tax=Coniosporium tulheliwenetii TaxID=3383036 RepID=A0ACC2YVE1_9PEZI|nr:hypothetical protein H2199_006392 [Cladosporium sp. JES 115]